MIRQFVIYVLLFLLSEFCVLNAQSIKDLVQQKTEIAQRIEKANKLLNRYKNQRSSKLKSVRVLNNQIKDREALINLMEDEIELLSVKINTLNIELRKNNKHLNELKQQYSKLILQTYNNRKQYYEPSFFFSAKNFNEAYKRYAMLKEYNRFRHNQGVLIKKKSDQLAKDSLLLSSNLKVKNNALNDLVNQKNKLEHDKYAIDQNIQDLSKKERSIKQDIKRQEKALKTLESAIIKMVNELAKSKSEPSDFHLAKGKLPWPVEKGVIVSKFGEHQHPVLKYVKVNNNGVDIDATESLNSKAVFSGKVSRIVPIPGYNKAVLIRHGKFLTVYANLSNVHVKTGQNVTNQTVIGTIYTGDGENSGVLHFEIWEESVKLNPELWLLK